MYENLLPRFLRYVKTETRSNPESNTTPSTESQIAFANVLKQELEELGLADVHYNATNGYVSATLPSNIEKQVPSIGFIAHMDTADFNAENVQPQVIENYDGVSEIQLDEEGNYTLNPNDFPNLKNYQGQTLITTDGSTLLGADDKAGVAEIMSAMEILVNNSDISHGDIKVAFGPDEEIGIGADQFDVEDFNVDFAYTMDGGPLGELEYETFNAAQAEVTIKGKNVHPGTAKDTMINALQVAIDFQNQLPQDEVPEKTEGIQGFFHLMNLNGNPEEAQMSYIIRDHDHQKFENRKAKISDVQKTLNEQFDQQRVFVNMYDQYYNMKEIIEKDMSIVELAKNAMLDLAIDPIIEPVRGGTDGSKISYMGIPTPNIFAGAENMHGRFEYVSLQTMEKAAALIVKIAELNAE
ncbi:peptidase T [Tetragenococcus koreensis]|uniref:Peptidase T n=1 Tax=Tetragenococcus koreensis TaxID=290335 RepID=A0AAN4RK93_9ENTE|nr:peptidase T [Tetragenococcus koreensis]AYW45124.1 peptidase T [Tetragenococcus koreensis]MCF1584460.1 peptidase T [Tetragenococcus koreensis]MCF1614009.1 peptidase T [Tetragenococcus koreensis]MCF1618604.1 peptidase T [Tetragenococcus koreensis]MCF1623787.1 peptidase T [Tetragenococcus koreensis]